MTLLLTLVKAPRPQPVRQMRLTDGELVIGRGTDADWRIDDPDQYVSRAHCTIAARAGSFTVTDTSSGGLFVDDDRRPLGSGRTLPLRDGMQLRLGDYVLAVELPPESASHPASTPPAARQRPAELDADTFFAAPAPEPPKPERPRNLPDPFERPTSFVPAEDTTPPERRGPPGFDDPFTLDPPSADRRRERPAPDFDWGAPPPATPSPPPARDFDWDAPLPEPAPAPPPEPARAAAPQPPRPPHSASDTDLLAAFLRGLGLDPADAPTGDPRERLEAYGREYRMMAEGLMHLLKMRAEEKGQARIAQTVVSSSQVNAFKFMPTVDDALAVLAARPGGGFSDAETAITGAVRDLAAHHVGTWRGTQTALRRMIDRFDPKALEKELEAMGLLETLLAGGRRAKLWELYEKRFQEIAKSAETRFLGEVGADFRDAYETEED